MLRQNLDEALPELQELLDINPSKPKDRSSFAKKQGRKGSEEDLDAAPVSELPDEADYDELVGAVPVWVLQLDFNARFRHPAGGTDFQASKGCGGRRKNEIGSRMYVLRRHCVTLPP